MEGIRIIRPAIMLVVLFSILVMAAGAVPPLPAEYYGKVSVDGTPAVPGTVLVAKINDQVRGKMVISNAGQYGGTGIFDEKLVVGATEDDLKTGNAVITFYLGDKKAGQTVPFEPGIAKQLDISTGGVSGIIADFIATPTSGNAPLTVRFTDTSSGNPTMWSWDFGDGTSEGMLANPTHTYQAPGTYTVKHTASSQTGGSDTKVKEGYITVGPSGGIIADFTAAPTSGTAPLTVKFTDISTGNPTMWAWDFGDGTSEGMLANPTHTYQAPGIYTVKHTASSQTGGSNTKVKEGYITVSQSGSGIKASFTADKRSGPKPLTVQFSDQSQGNPTMWAWDFGDGTSQGMLANPSHTYQEAGVYTVKLTASSATGSDTKIETDYISVTGDIPPPVAMFEATPLSGDAPLKVKFTDLSLGPPTAYSWDFGDGTTSTESNPVHDYLAKGVYTVKLTVKNSGGSHTMKRDNYITVGGSSGIMADFTAMPTSGIAPLTVQFTDTSSGQPTMWAWDFGDGTSQGMFANPSHTYQNPGTYTVKLTASSQTGGSSTKVKEGFIQVSPSGGIVADFIGSPTCGNAPLTVQFSDRSQGRPTMWAWDFGDGDTALVGNPVHIYQNPGRYTVRLTSSNQASSNTAIKADYIMVQSGPVGFGSIRIIYAPDRSSVYVDDVLKGETRFLQTFVIDNLQAGEHQIRISKPGFSDYVARVPVIYGHPTDIVADMRILPSQNGILSVYTYPVGSSVYVDGVLAGNGPLWKADVPPGVHQVKATSPGYLDWTQHVEVRGGGSVTYVTAALYPAWWTPIYGYIMVSSLPGNGAVFLDGVAQGHTPVTLSQVPPGQHTIRIELPGYQPWQQAVNVMEGRTAYVLAQMTSGTGGGTAPVPPVVPTNPVSPTNPTYPSNPTTPTNPSNPTSPIIASAGGAEPAADQVIMASVPSADTSEATVQISPAGSGDGAAAVPADIATGTAATTSTTGTEEYSVASAPADNSSGTGQAAPVQTTAGDVMVSITSADNASGTPVQATPEQTATENISGAVPTDNATGVPAMQTDAGQGIFSITSAPSDGNGSGGSPEQAGYFPASVQ